MNCGTEGDIIKLYMLVYGFDYQEAISTLSQETSIMINSMNDVGAEQLYEANYYAAAYYRKQLQKNSDALNYLTKRSISGETIEQFIIGYAPEAWDDLYRKMISEGFDPAVLENSGLISKAKAGNYIDRFRNRVMIPIFDFNNHIIAFGGRTLSDDKTQAKNMNAPETPIFHKNKTLFACHDSPSSSDFFLLVEGYFDVITLYQNGIKNCGAAMGTALSAYKARMLNMLSDNIIIAYDSDQAGFNAVLHAETIFKQTGIAGKALRIQNAKDPDEFIRKFGIASFSKSIHSAQDMDDFIFDAMKNNYCSAQTKENKLLAFNELARFISNHTSSFKRNSYLSGNRLCVIKHF